MFSHTSVVRSPLRDTYEWHERPGAVRRLTPPWLPVGIDAEASSLDSGTTVLKLPGGLRWVAEHRGADPPHRFEDELTSLPLRWRHSHEFAREGEACTRVTDRVDTPVPARLLRQTFLYRHRQMADDLATQHLADQLLGGPGEHSRLTIAVTGSSGLVGQALVPLLTTGGHRVLRLVRGDPAGPHERRWDPDAPDPALLTGVDAVVHLAGASIAGRFTDAHRERARESRVGPTRRLAELVGRGAGGPRVFATASAIGYYGPDRGDEVLTERSERGGGFLADLVTDWEAASGPASDGGARVVKVRTGIAQSPRGGVLRRLRPVFELGLGGPIGAGAQWMSWIDVDDLAGVYYRAVVDGEMSGPVNAVSPAPVTNGEFSSVLAGVLRRPCALPVPRFGPRLIFGEQGARELALASQRVQPEVLAAAGHAWRRPGLEQCLRHQLGRIRESA